MVLPVRSFGTGPHERFLHPTRDRIVLPFGGGLDRDQGVFASDRARPRDLRNLLLEGGKVRLRPGMEVVADQFLADGTPMTHILGFHYSTFENVVIVVGFRQSDRAVHVFRMVGDGSVTPEHLGHWFSQSANALVTPPIISMAESYQKVFLAHDERIPVQRAPTVYYDATTGVTALTADWAGATDKYIRFRGVVSYLNYLVGWGFGSNDLDRPELVRISLPGQPVIVDENGYTSGFDPNHYLIVGVRGDPVTLCAPAGGTLLMMKEHEAYPLVGNQPANFGVGPAVETKFGSPHSRLGVNVNGQLFVWTHEGPRITGGGPFEDLAIPLDLDGPAPADLVAEGAVESGFATYIPKHRIVAFVFGRRVYALSLREGRPHPSRWAYWELGAPVASAGWISDTGSTIIFPPVAGPDFGTITPVIPDLYDAGFDAVVNHPAGIIGDEVIEVWAQVYAPSNPNWAAALAGNPDLEDGLVMVHQEFVAAGASQTLNIRGLYPHTTYALYVRYRRAGMYHPDQQVVAAQEFPQGSTAEVATPQPTNAQVGFISRWFPVDADHHKLENVWDETRFRVSLDALDEFVQPSVWYLVYQGYDGGFTHTNDNVDFSLDPYVGAGLDYRTRTRYPMGEVTHDHHAFLRPEDPIAMGVEMLDFYEFRIWTVWPDGYEGPGGFLDTYGYAPVFEINWEDPEDPNADAYLWTTGLGDGTTAPVIDMDPTEVGDRTSPAGYGRFWVRGVLVATPTRNYADDGEQFSFQGETMIGGGDGSMAPEYPNMGSLPMAGFNNDQLPPDPDPRTFVPVLPLMPYPGPNV